MKCNISRLPILLVISALALVVHFGAHAETANELVQRIDVAARKAGEFLLHQQQSDGVLSAASNAAKMPGVSAVVVRALAGLGDDYRDVKNPAVAKAVQYMLSCQHPNGSIFSQEFGIENLNTSVAVGALAAQQNPAHRAVIEKARDYLLNSQMTVEKSPDAGPDDIRMGAFGEGKASNFNLMGTAFALDALRDAKLEPSSPAWKSALSFVRRCQDDVELNSAKSMRDGASTGGFVYYPGFSEFGAYATNTGKKAPKPYGTMTYQAVKSLVYCGVDKNDPALQSAFRWMKEHYDVTACPGANGSQGYYFYAMSMAKAFSVCEMSSVQLSNGRTANWAQELASHLLTLQNPDGGFTNTEARWMESNPSICTAYALEALSMCRAALAGK